MKRLAIIAAILVFPVLVMGQMKKFEYTPKVKNKVEIYNLLGEVSLQNTTGGSIIIESDFNVDRPKRAEGLKLLGSVEDNSEIGVNVSEENGVVSIQGVSNQVRDYKYKIQVPAGMAVLLDYNSPFASSDLVIDSFAGSLEIKTLSAGVKITNTSGPLTVNSVSGDVEISLNKMNQDAPISLATVSGFIDIAVPAAEKATFDINTVTGNVYNNLDLKSVPMKEKDERASGMEHIKYYGKNSFNLNGGGQKVYLKAISGDIYLRKR